MQPLCDTFFKEVDEATEPSPSAVNEAVRAYVDACDAYLRGLHDAGESGEHTNEIHADLVDRLIRRLFRLAEDRYFRHFPRLNFRLAVIAVGGYGRRELSFASDIDLLFLFRGKMNPYVETITESITHRLWDARLVVGSATRTLKDCMRVGKGDLPTMTSYLDARYLIGDVGLHADLERAVSDWVARNRAAFIEAKLAEQRTRHDNYGESLFLLQPNLRESVGGLRDYHTARWIARAAQWRTRSLDDLRTEGFVDEEEFAGLRAALEFHWRLRNELHRDGRKDDRLHFVAQETVAKALGYEGDEKLLPIEQLMRSYYLNARAVEHASERVIDHARALVARQGRRQQPSRPVAEGFAISGERLEIPHPSLLVDRPMRLLSAFAVAQDHDVDLSVRAERMIRQHVHLIDDAFRSDPEASALVRRILRAPNRVYRTLGVMNELGVLGAYLPEFAHLVGLWQHDLYHTYTVDAHSLFLVEQLRRLAKGLFVSELPLPTHLVQEVTDPLVLYLSCLLHDIGKGRGGGHSSRGAELIPAIGARLGLDEEQISDVRFLVQHHLTLSGMAENRDVHDPRLILNVASLVGTRSRLRLLYLLTVADIRSVSREAWTAWKAGLLEALYRNAAEWLEAGDESAPGFFLKRAADRLAEVEGEAIARLRAAGVAAEQARDFLATMPRRYLLNHGPSEIAEHVGAALAYVRGDATAAISLFQPEAASDRPFTGLVVLAGDRPGLLATSAGVLASAGHNVLGAQVYTNRGPHGDSGRLALEIYEIERLPGGPEEAESERARLERRLCDVLEGRQTVDALGRRSRVDLPKTGRLQAPVVRIANDESDFYSIIDIEATDRPGLLYDVTRTLTEAGLDVEMSRASTRANRVRDSFFVTEGGEKLFAPERRAEIEEALRAVLQADPRPSPRPGTG